MQRKNKMNKINFWNNKRGDIATMILVIGVFLVCAVTIFSFVLFNGSDRQSFVNSLETMAAVNSMADSVRFYENAGLQPEKIIDITKWDKNYVLTLERNDSKKRLFYVEYKLPIKTFTPSDTP